MTDEIEQWDEDVSALLAGRGDRDAEPAALWLAAAARPAPSPDLVARVDRIVDRGRSDARPGRLLALVAAALSIAFVVQGLGNFMAGEWIATSLGEEYSPHVSFEGGLAMIALGVCAAAAAVSRPWSTVSVLTCAPLAIGMGVSGVGEIGTFAAGVVLHLTEGALGLLLVAVWWRERRDTSRGRAEEGT